MKEAIRKVRAADLRLIVLCCFFCYAVLCFGEEKTISMEDGVRLPLEWHEDGKIKSQLFADSVKVAADGDIAALSPRIEFYGADGNIEALIEAEECRCKKEGHTITSESNVRFEKKDIVITGRGLEWRAKEQFVRILDDVKVVLKRSIMSKARGQADDRAAKKK